MAKRKTRPYCKLCVPPAQFSSLSALRVHQRKLHADRWNKAPAVQIVDLNQQPAPKVTEAPPAPPLPPMTLGHFRADHHLQLALAGYRAERDRLNDNITQLEGMLLGTDGAGSTAPGPGAPAKKKRTITPEGKAAIAAAQRKRWENKKQTDGAAAANA